jgi:hypothetical protein
VKASVSTYKIERMPHVAFVPFTGLRVGMGGIRLTEGEDTILGMRMLLIAAGVVTAPIWVIGYLVSCTSKIPWHLKLAEEVDSNRSVSIAAWMLACMSLAV